MILRSTRGPGAHSAVSRSVDRRAKNFLLEIAVRTHDCSGQVVRYALQNFQYRGQVIVTVFNDDLKRAKQFCRCQIEVLSSQRFERDLNGGWLDGPVSLRISMVL